MLHCAVYSNTIIKTKMNTIQKIALILLSSLSLNSALAQSSCSSLLEDEIHFICRENENWTYVSNSDKTTLTFSGNFTTNYIKGARDIAKKELKHPGANSVSFDFRTSDGWSDSTYLTVKKNNIALIEELKSSYINYYDSIGWNPRHSQSLFEKHPMRYLEHFEFRSEEVYSKIVRLPDFRINECGVWIDPSIDFSVDYIVQAEIRDAIQLIIQDIVVLDRHVNNSLDGIQNY